MSIPIIVTIDEWQYRVRSEFPTISISGFDKRELTGLGSVQFDEPLKASVIFNRGRTPKFQKLDVAGVANVWPPTHSNPRHLGIELDLSEELWQEVVARAMTGINAAVHINLIGPIDQGTEVYKALHPIDGVFDGKSYVLPVPTITFRSKLRS
jgi:hypothetical protein